MTMNEDGDIFYMASGSIRFPNDRRHLFHHLHFYFSPRGPTAANPSSRDLSFDLSPNLGTYTSTTTRNILHSVSIKLLFSLFSFPHLFVLKNSIINF